MAASRQSITTETAASMSGVVRAVQTRPGRVVLTADGTPDAWIASDLLVELRP